MPMRSLGSRACSFSTCLSLQDYAGLTRTHDCVPASIAFPVASTRSAPEMRLSRLGSRPVFHPHYRPVYPDDCAYWRARLRRHCARRSSEIPPSRAWDRDAILTEDAASTYVTDLSRWAAWRGGSGRPDCRTRARFCGGFRNFSRAGGAGHHWPRPALQRPHAARSCHCWNQRLRA